MNTVLRFNGWRVVLDPSEVIPSDPGAGTPAMVYSPENHSGTYWCVVDTGEIDCCEPVPRDVLNWLESLDDEVNEFVADWTETIEEV